MHLETTAWGRNFFVNELGVLSDDGIFWLIDLLRILPYELPQKCFFWSTIVYILPILLHPTFSNIESTFIPLQLRNIVWLFSRVLNLGRLWAGY